LFFLCFWKNKCPLANSFFISNEDRNLGMNVDQFVDPSRH
jgi:hypothetical protein